MECEEGGGDDLLREGAGKNCYVCLCVSDEMLGWPCVEFCLLCMSLKEGGSATGLVVFVCLKLGIPHSLRSCRVCN